MTRSSANLPQAVEAVVCIRVVLMQRRRRRVVDDAGRARAAVVLDLVAVEVEEADEVFLRRLASSA